MLIIRACNIVRKSLVGFAYLTFRFQHFAAIFLFNFISGLLFAGVSLHFCAFYGFAYRLIVFFNNAAFSF